MGKYSVEEKLKKNVHVILYLCYISSFVKLREKNLLSNDRSYLKNISRDIENICFPNFLEFLRRKHSMTGVATSLYLKAYLAAEVGQHVQMNEP